MKRSALTAFFVFMLAAAPAFAACTNPTGNERDFIYNRDYHTYQFCNGTNWIIAGGGRGNFLAPTAADGYFVMSSSTWNGNLGGTSGANAKCLTDLTTNTGWRGYADANARGLLTSTKVHAFICYPTCNNLQASTTYYFANAADATKGGASLITNSSGAGPGDNADWSDSEHFGGTYLWWSDRIYGTSATAWALAPWNSGASCDSWTSSSSGDGGADISTASGGDDARWYAGSTTPCNNTRHLICVVDP